MPGPVFIQGDSVELRSIEQEDVEFLQRAINDPSVRRYAGGDLPYNRQRYEEERFDRISSGEFLHLLICDGTDRLGDVSLAPIDDRRGWANLGYRVTPEHQNNGYASEAARLLISHGFDELRLHRISATIVSSNEASKRVVQNIGFSREGTKRDDAFIDGEYVDREIYAILREEWDQ